jgi:hypothetical protein
LDDLSVMRDLIAGPNRNEEGSRSPFHSSFAIESRY